MSDLGLDILGAGAELGGAAMNKNVQEAINKSNQEFAMQMSSTAYQRAVGDMQAAGLNPMAMYGSGGAGGAASATAVQGQSSDPGSGLAAAGKTILNSAQRIQDVEKQKASVQTEKERSQNEKEQRQVIKAQQRLTRNAADKTRGEAQESLARGYAAEKLHKGAKAVEDAYTKGQKEREAKGKAAQRNVDSYGGRNSADNRASSAEGG
jgi:hypothetical protein